MTISAPSSAILLTQRLQLGILPVDALHRDNLPFKINLELERQPTIKVARHPSGRFSLAYTAGLTDSVQIRLYDAFRKYVPRRLSVPLLTIAEILASEQSEATDYLASRVRYPVMFAGAAYPINGRATGIRGRVVNSGLPVKWTFIELVSPDDSTTVLARARGDDRGEFLLLIPPSAVPNVSLSQNVTFNLNIYARAIALEPAADTRTDPYWDVPLEQIIDPEPDDLVSSGHSIPADYVASQGLITVDFNLTRMLSSREINDIVFNPP